MNHIDTREELGEVISERVNPRLTMVANHHRPADEGRDEGSYESKDCGGHAQCLSYAGERGSDQVLSASLGLINRSFSEVEFTASLQDKAA
jgi:hypothetical protein